MNKEHPVIMILGPTGVGKSDFALQLAQQAGGEIMNCDVGQFYSPLTIGTAKPDWHKLPIAHHLYDIIDEPVHETVTSYRDRVQDLTRNIIRRNLSPIIVGGSGFYALSLLFPPILKLREVVRMGDEHGNLGNKTSEQLWQELNIIDPDRAAAIHAHDRYRLERALELWSTTGSLPSRQRPVFDPIARKIIIVHLTRDRAELYDHINRRTVAMFQAGWIEEVMGLQESWKEFLKIKRLIGYAEILDALEQSPNLTQACEQELVARVQQATRHYAKRQLTFWRMFKRRVQAVLENKAYKPSSVINIHEINLTFCDVPLYIKRLCNEIT